MVKLVELHCHLEGAASPAFVRQTARRNGLDDPSDIMDESGNWKWTDFASFLANYETAVSVFKAADDFQALSYDYYSGIARLGCIYAEVFVSPDCADLAGISYPDYITAVSAGMHAAHKETGIEGKMISLGIRHFGPDSVLKAAQTTADNPHPAVTGFGLAGNELEYDIKDFAPAFEIAQGAGLGITAHVGEHRGPDEVASALKSIPGLTRLGHGVRAVEDPAVLRECIDRNITFEVCPSSNVYMGLCKDIASHPIHKLKDAGARVTISSDDPPHFHTDIKQEYDALAACGWTESDLARASMTAIDAAFCPPGLKRKLKSQIAGGPAA